MAVGVMDEEYDVFLGTYTSVWKCKLKHYVNVMVTTNITKMDYRS